jgi:hypothetical protein
MRVGRKIHKGSGEKNKPSNVRSRVDNITTKTFIANKRSKETAQIITEKCGSK